ncbi:LPS export ABC transporter permease LptG [Thiomicrorhabdus sp. ZW0627]|uniref:LPS export ABC transporter permease LptG n=1 Tax=Thiomicrorhabdus sp. ZW0627 TaxID=3039774 RepID=UPI002436D19B|nr:LPS export ABC transporter permease LptG [Thiomicrorhabdus sp. ZW0627]MDG6773599.1 LPS export ABC transporter permease LptG [Thiomicrorhabdus sp. ZW0627]
MNRIERYLGQVVFTHTLLVLFVLLVILGFSEFMIQVGKLTEEYTLAKGTLYTLLKLPVYAYEIFPVALLIGSLMGLGALANQSELTILRVTGWSVRRILFAVLKTAMLMWLVMALMGEFIAPGSEAYSKKVRSEALQKGFSVGSGSGFWLKDLNRYIYVGQVISSTELNHVEIYTQDSGEISQFLQAQKATYSEGHWVLSGILRQDIQLKTVGKTNDEKLPLLDWQDQRIKSETFDFPLQPEVLESLNIETRYMSLFDLYGYISFLKENELDSEQYQLAFWRKLAMPLVVIGMIAIVFPLIFGSQRQVSMGQRVFVGILIGMGFHLANQMFGNLSVVYQLPAVVGAFLPAGLMLMIAMVWLKKVR